MRVTAICRKESETTDAIVTASYSPRRQDNSGGWHRHKPAPGFKLSEFFWVDESGYAMLQIMIALTLLLTATSSASAQSSDWPKRPIRFIVTAAPGSAGDTVSRIVGQSLSGRWNSRERGARPFNT